ncbi:hypothetical protein ETH_00036220 [Eimeria tenella]|uniref:Uncharacterized protein n=1 Tax=Eimeria tenella TaxID=5802 RepID=U6L6X7_EIMTE|nr:hypothetical protein ETH_00036220 [Eimeria tenella]CDJ44938.1 hypothetical protein ETH_00036220 [Eimeria tenella]|eukprot:XP_013235685.1 hypothetical protein ETH_00036220 [Eimeria tenella]
MVNWGSSPGWGPTWPRKAPASARNQQEGPSGPPGPPAGPCGPQRGPARGAARGPPCPPQESPRALWGPIKGRGPLGCLGSSPVEGLDQPRGVGASERGPPGAPPVSGAILGGPLRSTGAPMGGPRGPSRGPAGLGAPSGLAVSGAPRGPLGAKAAGRPSGEAAGGLKMPLIEKALGAPKGTSIGAPRSPLKGALGASLQCFGAPLKPLQQRVGAPLGASVRPGASSSTTQRERVPGGPPLARSCPSQQLQRAAALRGGPTSRASLLPWGPYHHCTEPPLERGPSAAGKSQGAPSLQRPAEKPQKLSGCGQQQTPPHRGPQEEAPMPLCSYVEPLPRSFLEGLRLQGISLGPEEAAAYDAAVRSNCLLWLPLNRRELLLLPALVVYTFLQNFSVASQTICCLAATPRGALQLQGALQRAFALLLQQPQGDCSAPGGPSGGSGVGPHPLIVRLCSPRSTAATAAADYREKLWQKAQLQVKWGDPATWEAYRGALKEFTEALRDQKGVRGPHSFAAAKQPAAAQERITEESKETKETKETKMTKKTEPEAEKKRNLPLQLWACCCCAAAAVAPKDPTRKAAAKSPPAPSSLSVRQVSARGAAV